VIADATPHPNSKLKRRAKAPATVRGRYIGKELVA